MSLHEHTRPVISALSDKVLLFNFLAFGKQLTNIIYYYALLEIVLFTLLKYLLTATYTQHSHLAKTQASPSTFLLRKYTLTLRH